MSIPGLRYYLDAKRSLSLDDDGWDVFISAYNDSDRVKLVFDRVRATRKIWWLLPEYRYEPHEYPANGTQTIPLTDDYEADLVLAGLKDVGDLSGLRICIDVTGLMRPHILFLMYYFNKTGVRSYDFVYTEPEHYSRKVDTRFSKDETSVVRQVAGFEGPHTNDGPNDILVVGVGYDHPLIGHVTQNKEKARQVQLHSLPSLSADMYHEALLRLDRVNLADATQDNVYFSSANDPYVTASTLSEALCALNSMQELSNIYLSTLATKPQAIGFGLFYLTELVGTRSSIIFPCVKGYERETGKGIGRSWVYPINL